MAIPSSLRSSYVVNPSLFAKIPYDPYKDFDPVTLAVTSTTVLVVNPSVPKPARAETLLRLRVREPDRALTRGERELTAAERWIAI
jgi:tripartite-type tricarboxylate transporter receptor subunit TctC